MRATNLQSRRGTGGVRCAARLWLAGLALFAGGVFGCADPAAPKVALLHSGSFTNRSEAEGDDTRPEIELHAARIWEGDLSGPWLYAEQSEVTAAEMPFRQRVYRFESLGGGSVRRHAYLLPSPHTFAGWWRTPGRFDDGLSPTDLDLVDDEAITLDYSPRAGGWVGLTLGEGAEGLDAGSRRRLIVTSDELVVFDGGVSGADEERFELTRRDID